MGRGARGSRDMEMGKSEAPLDIRGGPLQGERGEEYIPWVLSNWGLAMGRAWGGAAVQEVGAFSK